MRLIAALAFVILAGALAIAALAVAGPESKHKHAISVHYLGARHVVNNS